MARHSAAAAPPRYRAARSIKRVVSLNNDNAMAASYNGVWHNSVWRRINIKAKA